MKSLYISLFMFFTAFLAVLATSFLEVQSPAWLRFYANDFLCMPIVLSICAIAVKKIKGDPGIKLSISSILSLTSFYAIYFEWYLPQHHLRYTADALDVLLYFSGAFLFYFLQFLQSEGK